MNRRKFLWSAGALSLLASLPRRVLAAAIGYPRLLEGPMIGATTIDGFTVWSRASGAFGVAVEYARDRSFRDAKTTAALPATLEDDLVTRVQVTGLEPDTEYWYRIKADGVDDRHQPAPFRVRTAPAAPRPPVTPCPRASS